MEEKNVVKFKKEEFAVREYIKNSLGKGKVSRVKIEYTPVGEKIIISTNRPGLVIGRKGERIFELTAVLKNKFKLENPHIEIDEIIKPEFDAQIMADEIALGLEKFGPLKFKVIAYKALQKIMTFLQIFFISLPPSLDFKMQKLSFVKKKMAPICMILILEILSISTELEHLSMTFAMVSTWWKG